jgi:hypothetical protein
VSLSVLREKLPQKKYTNLLKISSIAAWTLVKEMRKSNKNANLTKLFTAQVNEVGMEPLKEMLKYLGGWPALEGDNWDDSQFVGWEKTILAFRKYVNKYEDNIFNYKRDAKDKKDVRIKKFLMKLS